MNSWIIENLGWTLLHSLWQIGFISIVLFSALQVLRDFSANLRYAISVSALILSLILPVATFVYFSTATSSVQTTRQTVPIVSKSIPAEETKNRVISEPVDVPPPVSADNFVSSPSPNIPFLPILVGLWLIGVLLFSIRLIGGIWTVHLYKTRKISAVETHWQEKFDELCESLQIRRKVRFLQSKMVEIPVVIGWFKPVVLVPASAFLQISPKELETILLHELTHIKRRDYLVNFLNSLIEILFFYHPCVWWISAKIRAEREFAVDEFISQTFETERIIYAKALANLEEIRSTSTTNLAMAANGGNLMKRIENILNGSREINSKNVSIWSAVFVVTLILGLAIGINWIQKDETRSADDHKNSRKIAVVYLAFSTKNQEPNVYKNLLELQQKYKIPATWVLSPNFIEKLKQPETAADFFQRARENRSKFIAFVPQLYTNEIDEYLSFSKEWIQFVERHLADNDDKFTGYSASYPNILPQEMNNFLIEQDLNLIKLPLIESELEFSNYYEEVCVRIDGKLSCKKPDDEKRKDIRDKYFQYKSEIFELNEKYYREHYGVNMPQILFLTDDNFTNDTVSTLLKMVQDKRFEFISLDEAVSDEAYKFKSKSNLGVDIESYRLERILDEYSTYKSTISYISEENQKLFKVGAKTKDLKVKP